MKVALWDSLSGRHNHQPEPSQAAQNRAGVPPAPPVTSSRGLCQRQTISLIGQTNGEIANDFTDRIAPIVLAAAAIELPGAIRHLSPDLGLASPAMQRNADREIA